MVEHDDDTILAADYVVDIGPGAGVNGGNVVYSGDVAGLLACEDSITGQYLSGKKQIAVPEHRRAGNGNFLTVIGAAEHNLKNITVSIPLGTFTCVTGVSGSGKSSLVNEIIYKHLAAKLNRTRVRAGWSIWTKSSTLTSRQSAERLVPIRQPIRAYSQTFGSCLPRRTMPRQRGTPQGGFLLTSRADAAKRVRAMAF